MSTDEHPRDYIWLAQRLGVSVRTARRLVNKERAIRPIRIGHRTVRFTERAVQAYEDKKQGKKAVGSWLVQ